MGRIILIDKSFISLIFLSFAIIFKNLKLYLPPFMLIGAIQFVPISRDFTGETLGYYLILIILQMVIMVMLAVITFRIIRGDHRNSSILEIYKESLGLVNFRIIVTSWFAAVIYGISFFLIEYIFPTFFSLAEAVQVFNRAYAAANLICLSMPMASILFVFYIQFYLFEGYIYRQNLIKSSKLAIKHLWLPLILLIPPLFFIDIVGQGNNIEPFYYNVVCIVKSHFSPLSNDWAVTLYGLMTSAFIIMGNLVSIFPTVFYMAIREKEGRPVESLVVQNYMSRSQRGKSALIWIFFFGAVIAAISFVLLAFRSQLIDLFYYFTKYAMVILYKMPTATDPIFIDYEQSVLKPEFVSTFGNRLHFVFIYFMNLFAISVLLDKILLLGNKIHKKILGWT